MKIACIATSRIPSSTANSIQVMKVCQAMAQEGHTVRLWVPQPGGASWPELERSYGLQTPFEVTWLASRSFLRRFDFIFASLFGAKRWGADLFYTWLPQAGVISLWSHQPTILELHDRPTGRWGPWWFRQFFQSTGKKRTLVVSQALQRILEQLFSFQFPGNEVGIAPNGADLERYLDLPSASTARQQLGLAEKLTVVYTGHFYAGRGIDLLLELASAFPSVQFLLVGGRPEAVDQVRAQASQGGMRNLVLTGFVENSRLPLYQAAGDVLLMPYERTIAGSSGGNSADVCSPMKMFEYMAAGRAILSSNLPVIREVLNQENARFAQPEDSADWKNELGNLLAGADLRQALGSQAAQDVRAYTWRVRARKALAGFSPD